MIDISVTGLIKSFDLEKKILDGITFQIDTGERVGLLGKNGAGKTTLFRILTGELDYDAGEVSIASGRRLGLISQIPVYPEGYTVEDVLKSAFSRMQRMEDEMNSLSQQMASGDESEETLRRYGELSAKFEGLGGYDTETPINKVANGLSIPPEMRERLFDTLSGGEKTRLCLARLLLTQPELLMLDEPTRGIDVGAKHEIYNVIYELAKRGVAVLFASSDLPEVLGVADRIVVMREGEIAGELLHEQANEQQALNLAMPKVSQAVA